MGDAEMGVGGAPPRRWLLLALAVLIPAIPVAIGIAIGFGKPSAGTASAAGTSAAFTPVTSPSTGGSPSTGTSPSTTTSPAAGTSTGRSASTATSHPNPPPKTGLPVPPGPGAIVAVVTRPTTLRAAPNGHSIARLSTKTQFGSPETVLVTRHVPGWLGVVATEAGNGHIGWISLRDASLLRITWQLKVSLAERRLTVLNDGKVVERYTVAIGQPAAPTPTGRFAVTDRLATGDPSGPYGCCILALSAHSPHAIQGWSGGTRIAIHSTPDAGSIGQAASHGCVRVTHAEGRWLLDHIPLGTPTLITS